MKELRALLLFAALLACAALAVPFVAGAAGSTVVDDTFADGNSQNQNLAGNSLQFFNARSATVRTDVGGVNGGSVTFDMTNTSTSAEAFWAHFTNAGSPVTLAVGDKLSFSGTFSLTGFAGSDIRFGLFDSKGSRNTVNLTGGQNNSAFGDDAGYGAQFFASGTGGPFNLFRRDAASTPYTNIFNSMGVTDSNGATTGWTPLAGAGATARQTLTDATPYTFTYTVERLSATQTRVTVAVSGGTISNLNYAATETSQNPHTKFDWFSMRVAGTSFAKKVQFTRLRVDYAPGLPVITGQPQPTDLVVQVGSSVTMSVGASGASLAYEWRRNGAALAGNASAATPTLKLTNVQLADAGEYTAVVGNASGSVTSNPVRLGVSTNPVPPPPAITRQPADTTARVGSPASLSVAADGDNLFYQWFRNGSLVSGANGAALNFAAAQTSDTADYTVVVSNSSGSTSSAVARLFVVSPMAATTFSPANGAGELNVDVPLQITFDRAPVAGTTGKVRIFHEDGTLYDTVDMGVDANTTASAPGPQSSRPIGGSSQSFNYNPVIVTGNTAAVYPARKLAYGQTYYVTLDPGTLTDAAGAPFAGLSDPNAWRVSTKAAGPAAGSTSLVVAADGSGDFNTVQGAVDFVPAGNTKRTVINVRRGTYTEIVYVASNKPFITVRGEDRAASVIQYANNNNFNPTSTTTRTMFGVDAPDFTLENITLHNTTPQGGSQAEAFRGNNNRIVLNRVNLKSFQDTLLLQGQSNQGGFVNESYIEGDVDFLWGSGAVYFRNTELKMLRTDAFYTQVRNGADRNGFVFVNCRLTRAPGITGAYLTRIDPDVPLSPTPAGYTNGFPFSQVVFINTVMDAHVRPDPWRFDNPSNAVNAANYPNIRFWEYNSTRPDGTAVDVSQRHPVSRQLTAAEAAQWSDPSFVLGGWSPQTKLTAAVSLSNLTHNYNGAPAAAVVKTEPSGLPVGVTYNGSPAPPTAIGTYTVVATVDDANYQGTATGTLVIDRTPVVVTLSNLSHTYDGTPKAATAGTIPAGPPVNVTYNGSAAPPVEVGTYSVVATINDPNYRGGTSATLTIYAPGARPLRAFPGAEGAGAAAAGGRGGDVYHVTNLEDSGPGSLREGVRTAMGPRTIVFDVAGTINLNSRLSINRSFLTIAGQTAPGDGITVAGFPTVISNVNNVVVRYVRFRMGDLKCPAVQDDALWVDNARDVILDHVSASWSVDETLSVTDSDRVTVQWSLITESMKNSCHEKGAHGYGSLIRYGSGVVTYHHNLYAHHDSRNPRLGDNVGLDFVNNVVYNWGGEAGYSGADSEGSPRLNYVGNYLVAGPSTPASKRRAFSGGGVNTQIYQSNNFLDGDLDGARDGADNGWAMFTGTYTRREPARFAFPQVDTQDAQTAYERVLDTAGHSLRRDSADERVVGEVRGETGRHINSQSEVGGFPFLNPGTAATDSDGDGIPDEWESHHGLNPTDGADGRAIAAGGYSNLEHYLNDLVPAPGLDLSADNSAPAASAALSGEPNAAGWHNTDVTVTLSAADEDGGSGLREIIYNVNGRILHAHAPSAAIAVAEEGTTTITYSAVDNSGNTGVPQTLVVKLDKTAPVIDAARVTPANPAGWNNTDVDAGYSASDALSGLAASSPATGAYTFGAEGAGQSYTFTVEDLAGNRASATVGGVNIDRTAPTVTLSKPAEGDFYFLGQSVAADYACGDALSGTTACAGTAGSGSPLDTATVGAKTFHVTSTDLAGNVTAKTVNYTVGFNVGLLYDPAKPHTAGSNISVKLQLVDSAGANLSSAGTVVHALGTSPAGADSYGPLADSGNANPGQNFRFDPTLGTSGGYIFNLKTVGYAPGAYKLYFNVGGDPHVYTVQFQIK